MADDDELTENDEELEDAPADELSDDDDLEQPADTEDDEEAATDNEDDEAGATDKEGEKEDDEEDDESAPRTRRRAASEEEDDDDEMLAPDDVEADLDRILKDRMVTTDDEEDDEELDQVEDQTERGETDTRLQPKRADEQLCDSCFLLVRANAPTCPVGDDDCPIFS